LYPPLASWISGLAEGLFATLFPGDCRLCGIPLTNISRLPVCPDCLSSIRPIAGGVCSVCGERLISEHAFTGQYGEPKCGLCRRLDPPFERAAAYGSYSGGLRDLIHLLKYEHVRPAANVLGRMLSEVIAGMASSFAATEVLVVPVPLHVRRLRERGFNQSEMIAKAALKLRPAEARLVMCPKALERRRQTRSQIGLSSHQRRENMRGAFAVTEPDRVFGHEILLVDDVLTTGTTASECARVLRRAGASKVWVATVARTLKEHANSALSEPADEPTRMSMAAHG
jgi:ComF family protein